MARLVRWECNEDAIWERGRIVSREGGMEFKDKIVLHSYREAKRRQGFTIMFWNIEAKWTTAV